MTDKLEGISPGDRVRVTFEAVLLPHLSDGEIVRVKPDGEPDASIWLANEAVAAPTFQIERIEPPLSVNDVVRWKMGAMKHNREAERPIYAEGYIVHIDGPRAWVLSGLNDSIQALSALERIA